MMAMLDTETGKVIAPCRSAQVLMGAHSTIRRNSQFAVLT